MNLPIQKGVQLVDEDDQFFDIDEGFEFLKSQIKQQQSDLNNQKRYANRLFQAQNQIGELKSKIVNKNQKIQYMSAKSVQIGKQFIKLLTEQQQDKLLINQAVEKIQKLKSKNKNLQSKLSHLNLQKEGFQDEKQELELKKMRMNDQNQKVKQKMDQLMQFIKKNVDTSKLQEAQKIVQSIKSLIKDV